MSATVAATRLVLVVMIAVLTACGLIPGLGVPEARISGVAGNAVSYCWGNVCADGVLGPGQPDLAAEGPYRLEVTAAIRSVTVAVSNGQAQEGVAVEDGQVLGPMPEGDWPYLTVFVQFDPSGDALYAWSLPPSATPLVDH